MKIHKICTIITLLYDALCYEPPIVKIKQGLLRGAEQITVIGDKTYRSFKGIPYAEPPLGKLRFKAPKPPKPLGNIRDATVIREECIQYIRELEQFTGSEDCLYLNVYTPNLILEPDTDSKKTTNNKNTTLFPVIVFFCLNFLNQQLGRLDIVYGPDFLVTKDIVLVTFEFKVGPMGFLNLGIKEVPGNAGLKDQVAVLKWIQQNIEVFGGNPKSVTILAHQYGAYFSFFHTISSMSAGTFHRIIAIGSFHSFFQDNEKEWNSRKVDMQSLQFLKRLGYNTSNVKMLDNILEELQDMSHTELLPGKFMYSMPSVEGNFGQDMFFGKNLKKSFQNRRFVDIMFGYCEKGWLDTFRYKEVDGWDGIKNILLNHYYRNDGCPNELKIKKDWCARIYKYYLAGNDTVDKLKEIIQRNSYDAYTLPAVRNAMRWTKKGRTYLFKFSTYLPKMNFVGSYGADDDIVGASNCDILNYIFYPGPTKHIPQNGTAEYKMVDLLTTAMTNFAKYGEPSPSCMMGVEWLKFDKKLQAYAEFADDIYVFSHLDDDETAFWKDIYKQANIEF